MKCAKDFRKNARDALRGRWLWAVLAGFLASIFGVGDSFLPELNFHLEDGLPQVSTEILGQDIALNSLLQNPMRNAILLQGITFLLVFGLVIAIAQLILGGIVAAGYARYNLALVDGEEAGVDTLFAYFPQWKTMLLANILQTVYILLWTMLFIIPGIVAAYRYAMTYFILAENPELTASEAIARSKELMNGNKWRMFCLHLSFIGWNILAALTLNIGNLFLTPYMQTANAAFYRDITGTANEIRVESVLLEN